MAIADVSVGGTITASKQNEIIAAVNAMGSTIITPSSVSVGSGSASIGSDGVVTLTAAGGSVSFDGLFSAEFGSYLMIAGLNMSAGSPLILLRVAPSTTSGSGYDKQRLLVTGTTVAAAQQLNASSWDVGVSAAAAYNDIQMLLISPFLATQTHGSVRNNVSPNPMTSSFGFQDASILHRSATSYDGLRISPSAGTIDGTVTFFGLS